MITWGNIDWTKSMQQTFEFRKVSPNTWEDSEILTKVLSCTIDRDSSDSMFSHATLECSDSLEECYVRIYLVIRQNGLRYDVPLGTFMVQTPSQKFDGKSFENMVDAYSPLIELKEKLPPLGYAISKGTNIMDIAARLCRENMRSPIVKAVSDKTLYEDFVANTDDTYLTFIPDLIEKANHSLYVDELGYTLFYPDQDTASLQPVWEYGDDNSSLLYPEITNEQDLYEIPNVVEVVYSMNDRFLTARCVNKDANSPISTVSRGREIVYRETDPSISGVPTQDQLDQYALQILREKSCLEHTVTYKHGYCPVRVGDCVLLNYKRAGYTNIKAKVISQSISCETGCPVEETAVYTTSLWR